MPICPNCAVRSPVGRVRTVRTQSTRAPWYRFAPTTFACPECGADLRQRISGLGWLLLVGAAAAMLATFVAANAGSSYGVRRGYAVLISVLAAVPFVFGYAKWGFRWHQ
jgi:hypothetical protein